MDNQTYLGDGVYASNDGFHIILKTDGATPIYLDNNVLEGLFRYIEAKRGVKIETKRVASDEG